MDSRYIQATLWKCF